jgi:hypothetical protein
VPSKASAHSTSAWRSRATIWVGTVGGQPQRVECLGLDLRVEIAVHADCASELADCDRVRRDRDSLGRVGDPVVRAGSC